MNRRIFSIFKAIDGVPEEFQVLPDGRIDIEGDVPAFLDAEAAERILSAFERRGKEMVVDYEHQTMMAMQAPAAGWIKKMVYKGKDGLWAAVEWTERAREYLARKEYKYFSPVMWVSTQGRKVIEILSIGLTNDPRINNLKPIVAKLEVLAGDKTCSHMNPDDTFAGGFDGCVEHMTGCEGHDEESAKKICAAIGRQAGKIAAKLDQRKEEVQMLEKLRKLMGLAADAAEDKVTEAVELLVNKTKELNTRPEVIACKEVLEAIGAKAEAKKEEVLRVIAGMKAPGDVAVQLSQQVAALTTQLSEIKQSDLVQLALKEGKTSPDELDKWGRDLALKNPDQFKLIVLSRPAGSVIPIGGLPPSPPDKTGQMDETQRRINAMMGISEESFKKYSPKA